LEVNPRISKSHCPLFADVEGSSHHEVAIDVALGRSPDFPRREGRFRLAAKFMLRRHRDGVVTRVPSQAELDDLQRAFPGTLIQIEVQQGTELSKMRGQDPYSYEVAVVFTGAANQKELLDKQRRIRERLPLAFDDGYGLEDPT
jgi:hypothetical protein